MKVDLADCKQRGMMIVGYYGKLKALWEELAMYEPLLSCTCTECKCEISKKLQKRHEEDRVHRFLMGLDDIIYGTARSNILACDPLPSLNRAYLIMMQEERGRTMARAVDERRDVIVLVAHTPYRGKGHGERRETNQVCYHYNRTRHESNDCFQVIGYPKWWGDKPRGDKAAPSRRQQQAAVTGGGRGCGRRTLVRANAVQTQGEGSLVLRLSIDPDRENPRLPGLNSEQ